MCEMLLIESIHDNRKHTLNCEYALISEMHLITRKYGNLLWALYNRPTYKRFISEIMNFQLTNQIVLFTTITYDTCIQVLRFALK